MILLKTHSYTANVMEGAGEEVSVFLEWGFSSICGVGELDF